MKMLYCGLASVLVLASAVSWADAQYPYARPPGLPGIAPPVPPWPLGCVPCPPPPPPMTTFPYGPHGGPGYAGPMPAMPFNGLLPVPPQANGGGPAGISASFPGHPYARSPRDFFMYYDRDNAR